MNRSLKLSMLLALALGSTQAAALDLGQIQVKSALGQPLLAEIPLTPDSPAELRDLAVRLASPEDFARAGLAGVRPEIPLQFSVVTVGGRKVIRITSAVAVNDPYLDLLVEVDSAAGRSLREFPVLLDPPGTAPQAPVVRAPRSSAPRTAARPAPAATAAAQPAAAQPAAGRVAAGGQYGPVQRGETLSQIAQRTAPAGVDPAQMMLALKQANPDAFFQDNINALKSGAVLRVPTSQEAQAMTLAAAMAEVRQQNGDWRAQAARPAAIVANAATRPSTSGAPGGGTPADRLALVPAKEGGKSSGVRGGSGAANDALRQDLLRSQEQLTTLQQQSTELKSRLKDLQDINDKNTRLLALKDNEIAELQQKLAEARRKAGLPAAPPAAAPATPVAAASAPAAAASVATASAASAGASAPAGAATAAGPASARSTAAAAKPVTHPAAKPVSRPAPPPAEEPWYMQTWAWAAAGGAIVLLILLALLGRRRKPATSGSAAPSLADRFSSLPAAAPASADPDQDELLDQLAEHPDDIGLHLELVSLYYERRDVEHFEAAAEAMHAHVIDPQQDEWQEVVAMGEDLSPSHPLFAGHDQGAAHDMGTAAPAAAVDFGDEQQHRQDHAMPSFDLDEYAAQSEPDVAPAPTGSKVSEYHFDFDLTPPGRHGAPEAGEPAGQPETLESDFEPSVSEADDDTVVRNMESTANAPAWDFEATPVSDTLAGGEQEAGQFSDDPIDTKLDLARAYLDMGDADGARGMLEEVLNEGSQMQKDAAQRLLDSMS